MSRAFITVGLGFGDEGKGSVVDFLCRRFKAKLVVRYSGGAQCGHNVVLPNGHRHSFAQFGAGTFAGAETFLDQQVIIDPPAMRREAAALSELGIDNPFGLLTVHPRCLVTTAFHKVLNHKRERELGHGSCGMGIGETRSYWLKHGQDALFAEDLRRPDIVHEKLELFRQRMLADGFDAKLRLQSVAKELRYSVEAVNFESPHGIPETVVFEGAQGILLDENHGFHPHTTWSDVTPRFAIETCEAWAISEFQTIGVTRAYMTRHGAGPLPTEADIGLVDEGNPPNEWQKALRYGWLDIPTLKRTADIAKVDYLAVNCLDEVSGTMPVLADIGFVPATADRVIELLSEIAKPIILGYGRTHEDKKDNY